MGPSLSERSTTDALELANLEAQKEFQRTAGVLGQQSTRPQTLG